MCVHLKCCGGCVIQSALFGTSEWPCSNGKYCSVLTLFVCVFITKQSLQDGSHSTEQERDSTTEVRERERDRERETCAQSSPSSSSATSCDWSVSRAPKLSSSLTLTDTCYTSVSPCSWTSVWSSSHADEMLGCLSTAEPPVPLRIERISAACCLITACASCSI